jgi:hypothetical protein
MEVVARLKSQAGIELTDLNAAKRGVSRRHSTAATALAA